MNKNLIIKIFGIIITVLAIPLFLAAAFALQGVGSLPDLSERVSDLYTFLFSFGAAANLISIPLILFGYIKNYKFNWISYALIITIVLNAFYAFSILAGIIRGDFEIVILLMLPAVIYIIGWLVYKNSKAQK